ncbi:hypothetical protein CHARACLAT_008146 [Characodon lateralis]|uniref:Uncharacterized protein n=1 Tax=Characodon lateralis TaxID=208331 RepID=A0ABU7E0U6_9TELE|nr:hypothetical protein [Characodon lateralis]
MTMIFAVKKEELCHIAYPSLHPGLCSLVTGFACSSLFRSNFVPPHMCRTCPALNQEVCPAFLPSNLCIPNQKTRALQVSCHIPVFPQALMGNGRMEWEEIYDTNQSKVP